MCGEQMYDSGRERESKLVCFNETQIKQLGLVALLYFVIFVVAFFTIHFDLMCVCTM